MVAPLNGLDAVRYPLLSQARQGARWSDGYPAWDVVADEHEAWLAWLNGHGERGRYLPRLRGGNAQRDETLAEIATAFFLEQSCGLTIRQWEPPGANGKTGEFLTGLPDGRSLFVEVKSPGWESEIVDDDRRAGRGGHSPDADARLLQEKYMHAEARSIGVAPLVREVLTKRAYPKLLDTQPNLVVLYDDYFVSLVDNDLQMREALYWQKWNEPGWRGEDGLFVGVACERLGAVGALEVRITDKVSYRFVLYYNGNALPAVRVPATPFMRFPSFIA